MRVWPSVIMRTVGSCSSGQGYHGGEMARESGLGMQASVSPLALWTGQGGGCGDSGADD